MMFPIAMFGEFDLWSTSPIFVPHTAITLECSLMSEILIVVIMYLYLIHRTKAKIYPNLISPIHGLLKYNSNILCLKIYGV